jgi:hypothetical protein
VAANGIHQTGDVSLLNFAPAEAQPKTTPAMKTMTSLLPENAETKLEETATRKTDWIALAAAVGLGFVLHLALTSESVIFPIFAGAIALNALVYRLARRY